MKIYLIRHGESTSDVEDKYGGDYNDHLTSKGRRQASNLAKRLYNKGIKIIFSSPRLRAKETAEIIQKLLGCNLEMVDDLRERNFYGILTGMKKSVAKKKYPKLVGLLKSYKNTVEGGEDYTHFKKRIIRASNGITNLDYSIIAIITHGGPISCIFREVLKLGEFKRLGDCAFFKIDKVGKKLKLVYADNAELFDTKFLKMAEIGDREIRKGKYKTVDQLRKI